MNFAPNCLVRARWAPGGFEKRGPAETSVDGIEFGVVEQIEYIPEKFETDGFVDEEPLAQPGVEIGGSWQSETVACRVAEGQAARVRISGDVVHSWTIVTDLAVEAGFGMTDDVGKRTGAHAIGCARSVSKITTKQKKDFCCQAEMLSSRNRNAEIEMKEKQALPGHAPASTFQGTHTTLRVDSRTANSGAILRCTAETARFSSTALIPSAIMLTAIAPMASMGCRTVVSEGV